MRPSRHVVHDEDHEHEMRAVPLTMSSWLVEDAVLERKTKRNVGWLYARGRETVCDECECRRHARADEDEARCEYV